MRPRLAVIVPQYRAWAWHHRLISALQKTFDVDVFTTATAPRYPLIIRLWMRIEAKLIGGIKLTKLIDFSASTWLDFPNRDYAVVVNFSETPIQNSSVPALEPQFDGSTDSTRLFRTLLNRKNPYLSVHMVGEKEPRVASYLAIRDRRVLSRALQFSFARLQELAERAVESVLQDLHIPIATMPSNATKPLPMPILTFILLFFIDKLLTRFVRRFQITEHWSVAILWSDQWKVPYGVPLQQFVPVLDDRERFYADPFPFNDHGKEWLFVEEFDYRTQKGIISCMSVSDPGKLTVPEPALARPYHLSHPFLFRRNDAIYLIPETGSNRTVELYRARSFPFDWGLDRVLMKDVELYDSTLLWHAEKWWIFGSIVHHGGSHHDELAIFYSEQLEGPWRPHRLNPVKSDCRSARPAGQIVMQGDRLLRPAQDCENGYGCAVVWLEIEELTTDSFREKEIARWSASAILNAEGIHTFNCDQKIGAIDTRRRMWSFPRRRKV
jgi:hypothetical protein